MKFFRSFALFVGLAIATAAAQDETILGGYTQQTPADEDTKLLMKAASDVGLYHASATTRICIFAVKSLQTQVVAGINYKFQVEGCNVRTGKELGACTDRACDHYNYNIIVFSQPWTDTLQVASITPVD